MSVTKYILMIPFGVILALGEFWLFEKIGGRVTAAVLTSTAALSGLIDLYTVSSKRSLDEILNLESLSIRELRISASKISGWKKLFAQHELISVLLKIMLVGMSTVLLFVESQNFVFWTNLTAAVTVCGMLFLAIQSFAFRNHIEGFLDGKRVEAKTQKAIREEGNRIVGSGDAEKNQKPTQKPGYKKFVLRV